MCYSVDVKSEQPTKNRVEIHITIQCSVEVTCDILGWSLW